MTAATARVEPRRVSGRGLVLVGIALAALCAWWALDAPLSGLWPHEGGWRIVRGFFAGAFHPALHYEGDAPAGAAPLFETGVAAARRTLVFAVAGMSLALCFGVVLGFFSSSSWWAEERTGRGLRPLFWGCARLLTIGMRSVHELLWAVLFLAAFGLNSFGAVIAIAIPYGGTLAKIFGEMLEEAPRDSARALRELGAGPLQVFLFGRLPRALPDMAAYAFYRFECAVRSSAVLGFFGFPTLGYSIAQSFENLHFREVWTFLYLLMGLVVGIELWSGALRRRFVA